MNRIIAILLGLFGSTFPAGAPTARTAPAAHIAQTVQTVQTRQASTAEPKAVNRNEVTTRLRAATRNLPVRAKIRTGYDRSKFKLWDDVNHDCEDTRAEVLVQESKVATTDGSTIVTGRWVSYYDNQTFTAAGGLDIDHIVLLAAAWDSGARTQGAAKRGGKRERPDRPASAGR